MRESTIEKYLVKRVKEMGGEVRKVRWIGRNGAPDRLVMIPYDSGVRRMESGTVQVIKPVQKARSFWVELKAPGKKPEAHQVREHARMAKAGLHVEVVDSIERVDEVLR